MRPASLVAVPLALAAIVIGILTILAGYKPGFMEEYNIISLNTSTLGHDLVPTATTKLADRSIIPSSISSAFSSIESKIASELDDIEDDLADKLAAKLGIEQWYSIHLTDLCKGTFSPNATASGASKHNITCTNSTTSFHLNITDEINQELSIGPFDLSLSDLGWSDDIQNGLDDLRTAMNALFGFYVAAVCIAFITLLLAIYLGIGDSARRASTMIVLLAFGLAGLSCVLFIVASGLVTYVVIKGSNVINKYGNDIGAYAYRGNKFLALTWSATGLMFFATIALLAQLFMRPKGPPRKGKNGMEMKSYGNA